MTLQELLADAQIQDDLEVSFGDKGKFKVGDLRAADKARIAKATADDAKVKDALAAAVKKQEELTGLATEAAALIEKLKKETPEKKVSKTDDDIDFDTDPLYSPIVKALIKPLQAKMDEYNTSITNVNKAIAAVVQFGLQDHYDRNWDRIPEARRPKDKTWKDYMKVATDKKILNEWGLPDPIKAFNEEVTPLEMEAVNKENEKLKAQVAELEKAAKTPRMPRAATSGAPLSGQKDTGKVYDTAEAMIDDAFKDPAILEIAGRA